MTMIDTADARLPKAVALADQDANGVQASLELALFLRWAHPARTARLLSRKRRLTAGADPAANLCCTPGGRCRLPCTTGTAVNAIGARAAAASVNPSQSPEITMTVRSKG